MEPSCEMGESNSGIYIGLHSLQDTCVCVTIINRGMIIYLYKIL